MADNSDPLLTGLAAKITEAISACLQRGMKPPFVVAMVGSNGGVFCLRYDRNEAGDGLEATPLSEHGDPGDFALPISMMIVDQTGEAARVRIAPDGATYH
jgi:hypothetical protein